MEEKYTEACQMFGEDGKKIEPSEFFKYFQDFTNMYFVSFLRCLIGLTSIAIIIITTFHH
jgi:hypothetical protein